MSKRRNLTWFSVSAAVLFLTLSVFSTCVAGVDDGVAVRSTQSFKEIGHGGYPWLSSRAVTVDGFHVYVFADPMFEIYSLTGNHGSNDVKVKICHILLTPNGEKVPISWWEGILNPGTSIEFWILCMYLDDQYGTYTGVITVHDSEGHQLDHESYSWVREPPLV